MIVAGSLPESSDVYCDVLPGGAGCTTATAAGTTGMEAVRDVDGVSWVAGASGLRYKVVAKPVTALTEGRYQC